MFWSEHARMDCNNNPPTVPNWGVLTLELAQEKISATHYSFFSIMIDNFCALNCLF